MARENTTTYVLLGFLTHEPMTGYEIKKRTERSISRFWNLGNGQIYPMLKKLQGDGLVQMKRQANDAGPDSKVYIITKKGKDRLAEWLREPVESESLRSPLLLKLFFSGGASVDDVKRNIEESKVRWETELAILEAFQENLDMVITKSPDHRFYLLTVRYGIRNYKANLEWAEEALISLGS